MPVLGICRGMQVMAVAAGGTLIQHLPDVVGTEVHLPAPGAYARHTVQVVPGTALAGILGTTPMEVPTYHHQGVATWPGYHASAWHADGTLEAMEDPGERFRLAVQWHPEAGQDGRLFDAVVSAARAWSASRDA
jgi:putative glutamine amidotransferase